ncbi:LacI family transcriptional regulator [Microlunatus elymi]|uniref:LacI family transcriptional regulator n=1 Tax=Microlunatus elymi TaxID=2596828 RepID=A0A516Q484_9ACTN|nr:LacI family DNA-binding transcriptional regulator [Microlunatus elymi]QDP98182.1 LacI family transcriptional regulator [Microlunatus elymi]
MTSTQRPVRITDVAALAGVSPGTVSKALNNTGSLKEATRQRVRAAADKLGFVPDPDARWLAARRSYTVGLLSADAAGRFSIPVMLGAENALAAGEMSALLATTRYDPVREAYHLKAFQARRVDGIIVTGRTTDPRPPVDVDIPVVYAFAPSSNPDDASVVPDDTDGTTKIIQHLLATGRRRIAHVGGRPRKHTSEVRAAAAVAALADHGLRLVSEPMFGDWSESWGRRAVDQLLLRHALTATGDQLLAADLVRAERHQAELSDLDLGLDAIICGSDQIARGVTDRLRELSIDVPAQLAVTGFDNWEVMALSSRPPLTTIDLGLEDLGRRAAEQLLDAIAGNPHHGIEYTPMELIPRASA